MKTKKVQSSHKGQTPAVQLAEDPLLYPLELVAKIATQMIVGGHVPQRPNADGIVSGGNLYPDAVLRAMSLLDACKWALSPRRREQQFENLLRDAGLAKEFPDGMPYRKALLYITAGRSQSEAQPIFKRWLREVKLADFSSSPPKPASDEAAAKHIEELKANNYPIFRPGQGTPPTYVLDEERASFRLWKEASIPATKSANAKKRAKKIK